MSTNPNFKKETIRENVVKLNPGAMKRIKVTTERKYKGKVCVYDKKIWCLQCENNDNSRLRPDHVLSLI